MKKEIKPALLNALSVPTTNILEGAIFTKVRVAVSCQSLDPCRATYHISHAIVRTNRHFDHNHAINTWLIFRSFPVIDIASLIGALFTSPMLQGLSAENTSSSADASSQSAARQNVSTLPWELLATVTAPTYDIEESSKASPQHIAKRLGKTTKDIAERAKGRHIKGKKGKFKGKRKVGLKTVQSHSRSLLRNFKRYRPQSKRAAARKAANEKRRKGGIASIYLLENLTSSMSDT